MIKQISVRYFILALTLFTGLLTISTQAMAMDAFASVSQTTVATNEVFQLKVAVSKRASRDAVDFSVLKGHFYVGRTNFGSSTTSINGKRTVSTEWTVTLSPIKTGVVIIPSFQIGNAQTQPIRITVTKDSNAPSEKDMVEFNTTLSQTSLYPKQSAILHAKLIIKADPRRLQNPQISAPSVNGMTLKPLGEAKQYQSVLNGLEVTIVEQLFRITAETSGEFTVTGPSFTGGAIYNDARTGGTRLMQLDTKPQLLPVTVMPIPSNFKGQWLPTSKLTLSQQWQDENGQSIDANKVLNTQVGQSLTRIITLTANDVTQQQLPNITIQNPTSIREYKEKPQFDTTNTGAVKMTLKQVLIPNAQGKIILPPVNINWWDSINKQQQTSTVKGLTLHVTASHQAVVVNSSAPLTPNKVTTVTVKDSGIWPYLTAIFATLWLITLFVAVYFYRNKKSPAFVPTAVNNSDDTSLNDIVQSGDNAKIQHTITQWLADNAPLTQDYREQIQTELDLMNQSYALNKAQTWSSKKLIKLISQVNKHKVQSNKIALTHL